ncbi:MAG: radical SAM protein [Pseudomonadota bacterium]
MPEPHENCQVTERLEGVDNLKEQDYQGFEQGPIRPPSEAGSLLLRVTRNCPWNRCKFCPVYKGTEFSLRPLDHVRRDIDAVHRAVQALAGGQVGGEPEDPRAWQAARHWVRHGRRQVFLQDANSLVAQPRDLVEILRHLKSRFPEMQRLTSYARSSTVAKLTPQTLAELRAAGLDRIHLGLESGSDEVLRQVCKGTTQKQQIAAGLKLKDSGLELSEYYMPGLGGRRLLKTHALQTAAALNLINPDFIRLRTLAIPRHTPLYDDYQAGRFQKLTDVEVAGEILLFLESLHGITSVVASDHILNLLPEVEGALPRHQDRMIKVVEDFLALDPEAQCLFQVGRRTGVMSRLSDLESPARVARAAAICRDHGVTPQSVDRLTDELMRRFI